MSFSEVRNEVYGYHRKYYSYIFNWPWYSYRRYKAIFYLEVASVMVFFSLKTKITPNQLTLSYVLLSFIAGLLLSIPCRIAVILAVILFFVKPAIDWADGALARIKKTTSITGDILDNYAAALSWVILWVSIGFYLGNSFNNIFYVITVFIPMIFAIDIYPNMRERFIYSYFNKKEYRIIDNKSFSEGGPLGRSRIEIIKSFVDGIFEHNARTVDLILAMIVLELFTPVKILWVYYLSFLVWQITTYIIRLYLFSFRKKAEAEFENLKRNLYE